MKTRQVHNSAVIHCLLDARRKYASLYIASFLVFATLVSFSAVVHGYSPIKGNVIFFLSVAAILFAKSAWRGIEERYLFVSLCLLLFAVVPMLYWQQPRFLLVPSYFILSLIVVSVLQRDDYEAYVNLTTQIVIVMLIGSIIGVVYAYFGGEPLLEFPNEDGRPNALYLTTLSNFQIGNFIRPSGIFDEPGALSFVICLVAASRQALGRDKRVTWFILLAGFVTTSVAHLVYVVLHAMNELKGDNNENAGTFATVGVLIFVCIIASMLLVQSDLFVALFLDRFTSGGLGDDRFESLGNGFLYLTGKTFFFGLDGECSVGLIDCFDKGYAPFSATPLFVVVRWGILLALPYYLMLIYLLGKFLRTFNFVALGILFLLLQRPYTILVGYSLFILFTVFSIAQSERLNRQSVFSN